jgi:hypothetical protein
MGGFCVTTGRLQFPAFVANNRQEKSQNPQQKKRIRGVNQMKATATMNLKGKKLHLFEIPYLSVKLQIHCLSENR